MNRVIGMSLAACCAALSGAATFGQENGRTEADGSPQVRVDEEVVVRGRSRAALRAQIRLAEDAVYERFNAINSDDEFDIVCRREVRTGTRIPQRVCQPNFWRDALADAGEETTRGLQGGVAFGAQQFQGEALHKQRLLGEEMRRLAAEDEQLLEALARLMTLDQAMAERGGSRGAAAASGERGASDAEALPYDAASVTDARIGDERWSHELTQRTFTIAHVHGEVRAVEIECGARSAQLEYEAGVEWTLPDAWEGCRLLVDAAPSTALSLYEFASP